jgi:hypothetical protein
MTLAIGSLAIRRLALGATLFALAACPADDGEEDGTATDTDATMTTTSPTTTSPTTTASTTEPSDTSGDTTPTDVDYATDIQPIWDANCTTGCHEPGGITGAVTVDLTAAASYNTLTTLKPVYSTEQNFVVAGSAEDSFLIDALRHPPGTIVRQMPLLLDDSVDPPVGIEGTPLPEATIVLIEAWIDAGANP